MIPTTPRKEQRCSPYPSNVIQFTALIGISVLGSRLVAPLLEVLHGLGQPTGVRYSHREEYTLVWYP